MKKKIEGETFLQSHAFNHHQRFAVYLYTGLEMPELSLCWQTFVFWPPIRSGQMKNCDRSVIKVLIYRRAFMCSVKWIVTDFINEFLHWYRLERMCRAQFINSKTCFINLMLECEANYGEFIILFAGERAFFEVNLGALRICWKSLWSNVEAVCLFRLPQKHTDMC